MVVYKHHTRDITWVWLKNHTWRLVRPEDDFADAHVYKRTSDAEMAVRMIMKRYGWNLYTKCSKGLQIVERPAK